MRASWPAAHDHLNSASSRWRLLVPCAAGGVEASAIEPLPGPRRAALPNIAHFSDPRTAPLATPATAAAAPAAAPTARDGDTASTAASAAGTVAWAGRRTGDPAVPHMHCCIAAQGDSQDAASWQLWMVVSAWTAARVGAASCATGRVARVAPGTGPGVQSAGAPDSSSTLSAACSRTLPGVSGSAAERAGVALPSAPSTVRLPPAAAAATPRCCA
jgi:hypothetical protein